MTAGHDWKLPPGAEGDPIANPEWLERQLELGELFVQLWLAPWATKRKLVETVPDLADPVRQAFAKLVIRRSLAKEGGSVDAWEALIDAHAPLVALCEIAIRGAASHGGELAAALDEVFDDHELWLAFHDKTGQPQE